MNSAASAGGKPPGIHRTIRRGQDDPVSTRRSDNWKDIARPWAWTIATAAILVIGGANNTYPLPRGLAEALAALLLGGAIASRHSLRRPRIAMDWLVLAAPLAVLVQFVPLPPSLWTALPGRDAIAALDEAVLGAPAWRPITLDIEETWRSLLFLIVPIAFYVGFRTGDRVRRRAIVMGIAAAFAIGAAMALLQVSGMAWAYPYADGRADNAFVIGFFTNHNHQATFAVTALLALLLLPGLSAGGAPGHAGRQRSDGAQDLFAPRHLPMLGVAVIAALLALLTASRAGLGLLAIGLALAACAWTAPLLARSRRVFWPVLGIIALGAGVFLALPFLGGGELGGVADRAALSSDRRFEVWPQALDVAATYMPTGSGYGTFRPAYEMHEPIELVGMLFVNHAHNDYIELAIEGGVLAVVLILALLALLLRYAVPAWLTPEAGGGIEARLGSAILVVVLLHSLVDYPARTVAVAALCGIALALVCAPRDDTEQRS